jgi:hypothetical protein
MARTQPAELYKSGCTLQTEEMIQLGVDRKTGGVALVAGYVALLVGISAILVQDPEARSVATGTAQGVLVLLVLPTLGLLGGGYTFRGGTWSGIVVFLSASFLAVFGIVLVFATGLARVLLGLALFALAVFALLGSLRTTISRITP